MLQSPRGKLKCLQIMLRWAVLLVKAALQQKVVAQARLGTRNTLITTNSATLLGVSVTHDALSVNYVRIVMMHSARDPREFKTLDLRNNSLMSDPAACSHLLGLLFHFQQCLIHTAALLITAVTHNTRKPTRHNDLACVLVLAVLGIVDLNIAKGHHITALWYQSQAELVLMTEGD